MAEQLNVLVVEDEHIVLMGLKSALESLNYNVVAEAYTGKEAVELAKKYNPDLILMDINLPVMDGLKALKIINKDKLIPSIIITGYNNNELIDRAKKVGAFGYLVKPINKEELEPEIKIVLARFKEFKQLKKELDETKKALDARKYIEKAKGILMDNYDLKEDEAMKALQKKSKDNNKKLVKVAKEIIKATETLSIKNIKNRKNN